MKRILIAGGALAIVLALLALVVVRQASEKGGTLPAETSAATTPATPDEEEEKAETYQGFLYGRVTTVGGAVLEGRLRFGGGEEAFWSDDFNGAKRENPWLAHLSPEQRPKERDPIEIFGFEIVRRERESKVDRPFMARFGDLTHIEAQGREVRVTLKSGTAFVLSRFDASDLDDGVRVWDSRQGTIDLDSLRLRTIELLKTPALADAPHRLHGTVRTSQGDFSGFIAWNRAHSLDSDELHGKTNNGELKLRFDNIRSLARRARDSSLVTLLDGREVVLSGTAEVGDGNRGIYVADPRYGRVLISWETFERLDFSPASHGGSGPAYSDFPAGGPLTGSVTTRDGRHLAGRLIFDLDESETTDLLDAPCQGVNYSIPFGQIASISRPGHEEPGAAHVRVTLRNGEELALEPAGDLGEGNAGMLIFADGDGRPAYLPWADVARVELRLGNDL